ncbi:hypothetical protein THAOC_34294 [Thalassiosira oceanica]|uniref:Uncharacterized protein n=1 Tax=Thalassiosira oceanica TaxID=159749 RepID=K0R2R8_THAOC|nr:hypothetical protein THAOC_34294 [Thalassiosira oceanica]|eukprot:EJK47013.1 hypothetical protein THAOC_34294 [Thalassiosira oceanica]
MMEGLQLTIPAAGADSREGSWYLNAAAHACRQFAFALAAAPRPRHLECGNLDTDGRQDAGWRAGAESHEPPRPAAARQSRRRGAGACGA